MLRVSLLAALLIAASPRAVAAQEWRSGSDIDLIARATRHRLTRDADTLLTGWRAEARGVVRFATVIDHGEHPVERVVRADELRVEVYGEAPNRSKQIIVAWRDTTFLPNRVRYHRDHLGIVANDFGGTIRLGEGDEVRDVPHPLSTAGLTHYRFALGDTLVLTTPQGKIRAVAVAVRPAVENAPGAVGTLFLDIDRAELVRFRFTFTAASYRDPTVEDITVVLENTLQENTRWLPWRQSIVIRRGTPWLDLPYRTVIRGDWTLDRYELGVRHAPQRFTGAFIGGLVRADTGGAWAAPIRPRLDALPLTEADVELAKEEASRVLGDRLMGGLPRSRLLAGGISDLLHINRVQGLTPSLGASFAVGRALTAGLGVGVGLSDRRFLGRITARSAIGVVRWRFAVERTVRDIGDVPVISGVTNSLNTLLGGRDAGDYVALERSAIGVEWRHDPVTWSLDILRERSISVERTFTPWSGASRPNPPLGAGKVVMARVGMHARDAAGQGWTMLLEGGAGDHHWLRAFASAATRVPLPHGALRFAAEGGLGSAGLPVYRDFVLGGRGTLPGVPFRALGGRRMARAEVAWHLPLAVPTPPFPYSRYVRLPSAVAPFVAVGVAGGTQDGMPWLGTGRLEPVAGIRLDLWGPLLRVETGVALRTGRTLLSFDVHPDWWPVM